MGFEFKLLFTNNVEPLDVAKATLNEAVLNDDPSSTNIKSAIMEAIEAVEVG